MTYRDFAIRQIRRFDSLDILISLQVNLYGQHQGAEESAEAFLLRKRALHERLNGPRRDEEFNLLALTQLRPELRSRLHAQRWEDTADFMFMVAQLKQNIEEKKALKGYGAPMQAAVEHKPQKQQNNNNSNQIQNYNNNYNRNNNNNGYNCNNQQNSTTTIAQGKYFTVLDLKSGYWQIPLKHSAKYVTAVTTPDGAQYHFNVMPFGLKNAPSLLLR